MSSLSSQRAVTTSSLSRRAVRDTAFIGNLGTGFNSSIFTTAVKPSDQKVLVGGAFTTLNGATVNRLVRLVADGIRDTDFGGALGTGFDQQVSTVVVQPDGRILVGGAFTTLDGATANRLVRLNADGTRDTTFRLSGTGPNGDVSSVVVQADGGILVGGAFTALDGTTANRLVRLDTDGTRDTTFSLPGTGFDDQVRALAIQADRKILVGGSFSMLGAAAARRLVRLS